MDAYLHSGRAIDLILFVILIEALILARLWPRRGLGLLDVVGSLLSGALLVVALRYAVTTGGSGAVLLLLCASFPAHLFDLYRRWQRAKPRPDREAA